MQYTTGMSGALVALYDLVIYVRKQEYVYVYVEYTISGHYIIYFWNEVS